MFIDSFIGYLKVERHYSAHTVRSYERDLLSFKDYVTRLDESLLFWEADTDVVRSWVASMMDNGATSSTVCRRLSALRSFFAFACANCGVSANPVAGLKGPK